MIDRALLPFAIVLVEPASGLYDLAALDAAMHWKGDEAQPRPLLNKGLYEHVSRPVAEIGRLLGGWIRKRAGETPRADARSVSAFVFA